MNTKTNSNYIDEQRLNEFTIVDPIDFLTEEQNNELLNDLKYSIENIKNPNFLMTLEQCTKVFKEDYCIDNV